MKQKVHPSWGGPTRWLAFVISALLLVSNGLAAWAPGTRFSIGEVNDRPSLLDPNGEPYKSIGMVWAYGPEQGPHTVDLTPERVIEKLQTIKALGFNTLNLYGDQFIPEMLNWCDENEMAVYFRSGYYFLPDFPGDLREYPDYMDPSFRDMAKTGYEKFLNEISGHPSVLAIDMDHRWLFPLDWSGEKRWDVPKLRSKALAYFPTWLAQKYEAIEHLNTAWGTDYLSFEAILLDESLVRDGVVQQLKNHPARIDTFLYTIWTPVDFLADLTSYMHSKVPGVLITPTTEHPECLPETNPTADAGIAFMSPVHYNGKDDYSRDPISLCKLIYETRWSYDLQGGPAYISETGWRTDVLNQNPSNRDYAWIDQPTEEKAARAYARQFALLNVLPWVSGYGWFKLYDKWSEGDFGYLRDDGSQKPIALVGDAINGTFDTASLPDPEPAVWIYYPDYAHGTHRPGFQQLKSLIYILEKDFLDALERRVDEQWHGLSEGDKEAGQSFADAVTADFDELWRGFSFATELPDDDQPIILLSTISEILSAEDRATLVEKKTISFGSVGVRDLVMRETWPWSLEILGVTASDVDESYTLLDLSDGSVSPLEPEDADGSATDTPWNMVSDEVLRKASKCSGQLVTIPAGHYKRLELVAGASRGNAAPFCYALYSGGDKVKLPMGPTISDLRYAPIMTPGLKIEKLNASIIHIPLEPERELVGLELPDASWVYLFGAVLVSGGAAEDVLISLNDGTSVASGETKWWLSLDTEAQSKLRDAGIVTLQTNEKGLPLAVGTESHVVYLYDPLNWASGQNEISRLVDLHKMALNNALDHLNGAHDNE